MNKKTILYFSICLLFSLYSGKNKKLQRKINTFIIKYNDDNNNNNSSNDNNVKKKIEPHNIKILREYLEQSKTKKHSAQKKILESLI